MLNSSQQGSGRVRPALARLVGWGSPYVPLLRRWGAVAIFCVVGAFALVFAVSPVNTAISYRLWGSVTAGAAAVALLLLGLAAALRRAGHGAPTGAAVPGALAFVCDSAAPSSRRAACFRSGVYAAFLLVSAVGPLLWGVVVRARMACPLVSQECGANMETAVVERAGRLLLRTGSPYIDTVSLPHPQVSDYNPYSPLMAVFGLPAGWWGTHWWTDARLYTLLVTVLVTVGAWLLAGRPRVPAGALLVLVAVPPVTMNFVAAGLDAALVTLLLLCVVAAFRGYPVVAALAGAVALGMKMTALPVVVVVAVALGYRWWGSRSVSGDDSAGGGGADGGTAGTAGGGSADSYATPSPASSRVSLLHLPTGSAPARQLVLFLLVLVAGTVAAYLPFWLANPDAMLENIVRYTTGSSLVTSSAQGGTPGQLIASTGVVGVWVARGLLLVAALGMVVWMVQRPPVSAARAFWVCAVGMAAAMLLMPASRFGYLIYPAVLAASALVARAQEQAEEQGR